MSSYADEFTQARDELQKVAMAAAKLSCVTTGRTVSEWGHEYASYIFTKICAHALSILSLAPTGLSPIRFDTTEMWDMSSLCSIARSLIDAYYAMYYVAIDPVSSEERSFREALWQFHGEHKRLELLQLIKARSPELQQLEADVERLRTDLMRHAVFARLSSADQRRTRKGELALHLSNSELSIRAGIQPHYYQAAYRFLSSYTHTYPFAVSQLVQFRAGNPESLQLIATALKYGLAFLCAAVRDFRTLFPDVTDIAGQDVDEIIQVWTCILANIHSQAR